MECPICAKVRTGLRTTLVPVVRNLQPPRNTRAAGWDNLTITPPDDQGYNCLSVFIDLTTGQTALYPQKNHSADSLVDSLFSYYATYGRYDELHTDPGSDVCSAAVKQLNAWFKVFHRTSLVDVHTSNGVENTNGRILRFLLTLIAEKQVQKIWGRPSVTMAIQFHLNDTINSEYGVRPFDSTFGTEAGAYFLLPTGLPPAAAAAERLKALNEDLLIVRDLSYKHRSMVIAKRQPHAIKPQNRFQPGDLVLFDVGRPKASKLSPNYAGPFEVINQTKNDVTCRHVVLHFMQKFHVSKLGMFHGTPEEAQRMAMLDKNQHVVLFINAHRGVPSHRSGMEFGTQFADGDYIWLPYSTDISATEAFEKYCSSKHELQLLLLTTTEAQKRMKELNSMQLPLIINQKFYLPLRYFGEKFYDSLQDLFKDAYSQEYYYQAVYENFTDNRRLKVKVSVHVRSLKLIFNGVAYALYGQQDELPNGAVLVDREFLKNNPAVLNL